MSPAPITLSAESVPSVQAAPAVGDTETTAPPPLDPALERLLTTLRCQQGALAEAEQVLKTAKEVSPEHPAVLEVEGDIAAAKGMHTLAERLYRQAFQADRGNARLEEKFANALLKTHQHEYDALPDDSTWSDRVQREPVVSAILSVLLPGLGQFFNGDYLKGAILVLAWAILLIIAYYVPVWDAMQLVKTAHSTFFEALSRCLLHGGNLIITLLLLGVWLYGIIDAAMLAKQPDR